MFYNHFHGINVDGINVLNLPTFALFRNDNIEIFKKTDFTPKKGENTCTNRHIEKRTISYKQIMNFCSKDCNDHYRMFHGFGKAKFS